MKETEDDFYIGWSDRIPGEYLTKLRILVSMIFLVTSVLVTTWILQQRPFADSVFDYGNQTQYTGTIFEYPAPLLRISINGATQSIPLVNFGKFGVKEILDHMKEEYGDLSNKVVTLSGTRIEYDDRVWLELSDGIHSIKEVKDGYTNPQEILEIGTLEVHGEIVDPKCFFGVMKPGFGKVHLSCAVRCIAGGIPAILTTNPLPGEKAEYYFLTGIEGKNINNDLLKYVGMPVSIRGELRKIDDWESIELSPENIEISSSITTALVYQACN